MSITSTTIDGQFSDALSISEHQSTNATSIENSNCGEYEMGWISINSRNSHGSEQQVTPDVSTITRDFSLDTASTLESIDTYPSSHSSPIATIPRPLIEMTAKEEMYRHIQEKVQRDFLVTWKMPKSMEYTSVFVDPISRELFLSGNLAQYPTRQKGGLVWYKVSEEAEEAAVARALDCFDFRNETPHKGGQRVGESPYLVGNEPPVPSSICPKVIHRLSKVCKPHKLDPIGPHVSTSAIARYESAQPTEATSPKAWGSIINPVQVLVKFYNDNHAFFGRKKGILVQATNYVWWTNNHNAHACAFVCPVFGDIFLAGKLLNSQDARFERRGGLNWYGTKREAQKAAAGHALDCLSRRKTRIEDAHQFCLEVSSPEEMKSFDDIVQLIPPDAMEQIQDLRGYSK